MARDHVRMKRPTVPKKGTVTLAEETWARIENYRRWRSLQDGVDYSCDDVIEGFAASLDRNKEFVTHERKLLDEAKAKLAAAKAAAAKAAGVPEVAAQAVEAPEVAEPEGARQVVELKAASSKTTSSKVVLPKVAEPETRSGASILDASALDAEGEQAQA